MSSIRPAAIRASGLVLLLVLFVATLRAVAQPRLIASPPDPTTRSSRIDSLEGRLKELEARVERVATLAGLSQSGLDKIRHGTLAGLVRAGTEDLRDLDPQGRPYGRVIVKFFPHFSKPPIVHVGLSCIQDTGAFAEAWVSKVETTQMEISFIAASRECRMDASYLVIPSGDVGQDIAKNEGNVDPTRRLTGGEITSSAVRR